MKANKLIEIAIACEDGNCHDDCPFRYRLFNYENINDCQDLIVALANKLEKATADITRNCHTCIHNGKTNRELPCSLCEPFKYNKWQWRGDSND